MLGKGLSLPGRLLSRVWVSVHGSVLPPSILPAGPAPREQREFSLDRVGAPALRTCTCPGDAQGGSERTGLGPEHSLCQASLPWGSPRAGQEVSSLESRHESWGQLRGPSQLSQQPPAAEARAGPFLASEPTWPGSPQGISQPPWPHQSEQGPGLVPPGEAWGSPGAPGGHPTPIPALLWGRLPTLCPEARQAQDGVLAGWEVCPAWPRGHPLSRASLRPAPQRLSRPQPRYNEGAPGLSSLHRGHCYHAISTKRPSSGHILDLWPSSQLRARHALCTGGTDVQGPLVLLSCQVDAFALRLQET